MNKLTNEEIARVFAMYLHSKVVFDNHIGNIHTYYLPAGKHKVGKMWFVSLEDDHDKELSCSVSADKVKLLLTPLSKITDEHGLELMLIEYKGYTDRCEILKINRRHNIVEISFRYIHPDHNNADGYSYSGYAFSTTTAMMAERFQYLISKGYAVPLFFGLNHWANGKSPIELGLAIESL